MSKLSFEIFRKTEHLYNWDKRIEFFEKTDNIDDEQRKKLINAFLTLKSELGKNFLKNTGNKKHIITYYVFQRGEEAYSWLIWLAENLNYFKQTDCNYDELLKKIRRVKEFETEGIPFLEIADDYRKMGFQVIFEPLKGSNGKNPDLKIINAENNEVFYIEISKLNDSKDRIEKGNIYYKIINEFYSSPMLLFAGKILRKFEQNELNEVIETIKEIKTISIQENRLIPFSNNLIVFAVAPTEKVEELDNWCKKNNYKKGEILSLELNIDETKRITGNKLPNKVSQIPPDNFGLIYIPVNPLYLYFKNPFESIREIEKKLNTYPHILGICIYSKVGDESQNKGYFDKLHYYGNKTIFKTLRKDTMFVFNNKCKKHIYPNTLEKIYRTFNI